jgi:sodium/pantothenate symporter
VVVWYFYGYPLIHPVFVGLICGTAAYLIGSLATSRPEGVKTTG